MNNDLQSLKKEVEELKQLLGKKVEEYQFCKDAEDAADRSWWIKYATTL